MFRVEACRGLWLNEGMDIRYHLRIATDITNGVEGDPIDDLTWTVRAVSADLLRNSVVAKHGPIRWETTGEYEEAARVGIGTRLNDHTRVVVWWATGDCHHLLVHPSLVGVG